MDGEAPARETLSPPPAVEWSSDAAPLPSEPRRPSRTLIYWALFLSGAAGLVHEVVWAKLLQSLIGSTAQSQAVVLSVFMGGLALGAVLFGRRSDARGRPLAVYVALEIGIGLYCLVLPLFVRAAGLVYERAAGAVFESSGTKLALRLALALAVVLPPAVLMGGTLPVLARALVQEVGQTRRRVAGLYALNNLGAVLGSALAGFLVLPAYGIWASLGFASALNFAAAGLAWIEHRRPRVEPAAERGAEPAPAPPAYAPFPFAAALAALFLSGFAAMGYEVVFLRVIGLSFGSSTWSFTVMLICFITGIGVGSALVVRRTLARPLWTFAASQLAVVIALVAVTPLLERLPYLVGSLRVATHGSAGGFEKFLAGSAVLCLALLLVPTACIGLGFPIVSQIQARSAARIGGAVGTAYAWNTVGNVLGVVATSLWLLPDLGIERALHVHLALTLLAGLLLALAAAEAPRARRLAWSAAAVGAGLVYALAGRGWSGTINLARDHLRLREGPDRHWDEVAREAHAAESFAGWKRDYVVDRRDWDEVFVDEDPDTTVLATRKGRLATLYVNSKGDASTGPLDMLTQLLLGHAPMFFVPHAKSVLVIGHGSGITGGSVLQHEIERLDVVEISGGVLAADRLFADFNQAVLSDPRTHVQRDDARTYLRTVPRKYDVIISEPSNPWVAGVGGLFTVDFFRDGRERLNPGGAMGVWFHSYEQSDPSVRLILRTIRAVFPHAQLVGSSNGDAMAIASVEPLELDFAVLEKRFDRPEVRRDLARIGVLNLSNLLAYHLMGPARVRFLGGDGPLNTDNRQRLEYVGARNLFLGSNSQLVEDDVGFARSASGESDDLLEAYAAWRERAGDPLTRPELETGARNLGNTIGAGHRLVRRLAGLAEKAPPASGAPASPSRGGAPALDDMDWKEANIRASSRLAAGDLETAAELWRRSVELEPGEPWTAGQLAQTLHRLERFDDAVDVLERAAKLRPDEPQFQIALARLHIEQKRPEDAKRVLSALVARREDPEALVVLGDLFAQDQDYASAKPLYERALSQDPRTWMAAGMLAQLVNQEPDGRSRALDLVDEAIRRQPQQQGDLTGLYKLFELKGHLIVGR